MTNNKTTIGVLGGLGPHTTSVFYLDIIERATNVSRPSICIYSVPVSLQKEQSFIENGSDKRYFENLLKAGLTRLEKAGSTHVVLPCNTLHEFHDILSAQTTLKFPNLIKFVSKEIKEREWTEIFLLATSRTLSTKLYQNILTQEGIKIHTPSHQDQVLLDQAITTALQVKDTTTHKAFLNKLINKTPCKNIVLGCTDLQLLLPHGPRTIDSTRVLADSVVEIIRGN
jgi:aspartate racemase